jgi:hypothetical protein
LKFGTSKDANSRYTYKYLDEIGVKVKKIDSGISLEKTRELERKVIMGHEKVKGKLPPGNKYRH